ncbi:hypothetical protein AAFF_G00267640 [Aldrovandia affinis]|uniref:Uncharacterized protein n=1 Tax=Aldrovandia affinis TaxID=143900 RepID=A0AAD7SS04_9TELE|nr:hypothetical protein AAFF_G00267640 [Aldrovandia affinis]
MKNASPNGVANNNRKFKKRAQPKRAEVSTEGDQAAEERALSFSPPPRGTDNEKRRPCVSPPPAAPPDPMEQATHGGAVCCCPSLERLSPAQAE